MLLFVTCMPARSFFFFASRLRAASTLGTGHHPRTNVRRDVVTVAGAPERAFLAHPVIQALRVVGPMRLQAAPDAPVRLLVATHHPASLSDVARHHQSPATVKNAVATTMPMAMPSTNSCTTTSSGYVTTGVNVSVILHEHLPLRLTPEVEPVFERQVKELPQLALV